MVGCLDNAVGVLDIVDVVGKAENNQFDVVEKAENCRFVVGDYLVYVVGRLADFLGFADRNRMVSQNPHLRGETKTIVIVFRSKAPPFYMLR